MYLVTVTMGVLEEVSICVAVGAARVGVAVAGKRPSGVMVGTGDERATCSVPMRSCALPVEGISAMICCRMFSLMGGTTRLRGSPL
jgi:hypothetical protein